MTITNAIRFPSSFSIHQRPPTFSCISWFEFKFVQWIRSELCKFSILMFHVTFLFQILRRSVDVRAPPTHRFQTIEMFKICERKNQFCSHHRMQASYCITSTNLCNKVITTHKIKNTKNKNIANKQQFQNITKQQYINFMKWGYFPFILITFFLFFFIFSSNMSTNYE
jgi:hypothetical protein